MFFVFPMKNTSPSLGPIQSDKQLISVYDSKLGSHRTLVATPEECDKFINDRDNAMNGFGERIAAGTVLGLGAGAGIGAIAGKFETNKINQLVDKMNELLKQGISPREAAWGQEKYFELKELYDKTTNTFKKLRGSKIKELAGYGILVGTQLGLVAGCVTSLVKTFKNRNALTREFIATHNQVEKPNKE